MIWKEFGNCLDSIVSLSAEEIASGQVESSEDESLSDLKRAYGYLLNACKLKETSPPEIVRMISMVIL